MQYINMLTRPPSTRSVWPINSVKASNGINASFDCCCPTAARYVNMLTRPPSTVCSRFIRPINSINTSESRKFEAEVHSYFVRPTFDGRHRSIRRVNDQRKIGILLLFCTLFNTHHLIQQQIQIGLYIVLMACVRLGYYYYVLHLLFLFQ